MSDVPKMPEIGDIIEIVSAGEAIAAYVRYKPGTQYRVECANTNTFEAVSINLPIERREKFHRNEFLTAEEHLSQGRTRTYINQITHIRLVSSEKEPTEYRPYLGVVEVQARWNPYTSKWIVEQVKTSSTFTDEEFKKLFVPK